MATKTGNPPMAAINRAKTHCPKGHAYDEANTYRRNGGRHCRMCRLLDVRRRRAEQLRDPEARAAHLESRRAVRLARTFGLTTADYDALLLSQGGGCAICGSTEKTGKRLAVDHDHETGRIRGLLCSECNLALGKLRTVEKLASALLYLGRYS